ncbi:PENTATRICOPEPTIDE REPEAT (PPR) SUPERFAMILY PROTEIN [Salix viminalis]|uniref:PENTATRICOPEPTIDE REPEAT (PPR) SUPERFAMILY PROTEIN n=1 Tax=Salix viminalis TaxID=40686 RepID=A0A9Q0SFC2_SALVM|nr:PENTATRICOPEPTIDE REPEAT (PPR) SUPERFAMILY PROTEIN [Salix viminalis]
MDSQDPRKNPSLTPGHESHGVYVCNKCGWPFPNPHPSARHRRAHKKICGTLKGYKFVDSEETPLSALSDDDRGSDEDPKTPSPKGLGRGINEKGSGGVGSRSNRSEDDVFTDAIAEFPESGSSSVTGEHTKDVKEPEINLEVNKAAAQSSEDGSITVISPPPSNSADHIHMQSTEVPVINLSESPQESLDHDLNATIASMSRTLTDFRGEQSGFEHSHDNRSSARDPIPIELETQTDASQEKKSVTVEDLPKTDAKGNEETKSEGQLLDVVDSTNDNAKDVSEVASKSQKMEDVTSQPVPAAEVPQLKEGGYTDDLASGMSLNDHYPEVKSVEPAHSSISTAQIKGDAPQEIDSAVYANSTVTYDNKGEGNENVHVLVVPNDLTVVSDAENMVKGFKDLEGGKLPKLMNVDSFDVFNNVKDSDLKDNPQVLNSRSLTEDTETSASDMHVLIDNLEPKDGTSQHIVEEFLDEAEADVPQISEVSVADVVTGDLEKSISVHSPEENVPRDHCDTSSLTSSIEHATKVIPDTNTVVVPSDAEVRQTKLVGMDGTGNDEKDKIESSEIGVKDIFAENTIPSFKHVSIPSEQHASIPSEQADQRNRLHGDVKAAGLEEGKIERCNVSEIVTEGDSLSGLGEENLLRKTKTIPESAVNVESRFTSENEINVCEANLPQHASIPSDQADQRNRLHGDVIAAGLEEGKIERCNVSEIVTEGDSVSGLGEENLLRNPKTTPESAVNVESRFTSENEINVCEVKLPHHEHTDIGRVLDPQESRKEPESNGMANQQAEHAGEDSTAAESDSGGGDVEVLRKSSEEKMVREPLVSPSEPSSTLQNSSPVAHNQARDFPGVASGNTPESLPDEGVNYFATQQVVASATDFSADSISQTDSLEGHWGSVSVLSTQSDIPAILDAEPLPSNGSRASEAEEATLKKPIAASETEHADKSDIFDPPSVTALIEPRDVVNQKAAASEIQTTWNPQQPKAASVQAGLSPSITDVSNEWQGRKKHEEIMAKVTDWSTGKQHTPLKNLLGEASMETRFKSLNAKEIPVEKDGPAAKDNGSLPKTVSSILAPQEPEGEPAKLEEKAWSSPARYPADIKREKRRVRGRPYWAQFVCCSSVN